MQCPHLFVWRRLNSRGDSFVQRRTAPCAPAMIVITIPQDSECPGLEIRPRTKAFARFPGLAERVLEDVLGKRDIARQAAGKSAQKRQEQNKVVAKRALGICGSARKSPGLLFIRLGKDMGHGSR